MYPIGTKLTVHPKVATLRAGHYDIITGKKCKEDSYNTMYFNRAMKKLAGKVVTVIDNYWHNQEAFNVLTTDNGSWVLIPDWVHPITLKEL